MQVHESKSKRNEIIRVCSADSSYVFGCGLYNLGNEQFSESFRMISITITYESE